MAVTSFLCGLVTFHLLAEGGAFSAPFSTRSVSVSANPGGPGVTIFGRSQRSTLLRESSDDSAGDEGEQDWRLFRAKLVASEKQADADSSKADGSSSEKGGAAVDESDLDGLGALFKEGDAEQFTPLDESQWAYDSGSVIETGAVILGGVEQEFGFGLRQQYFHKVVMLILDHKEGTFTKGIILNRPSDRMLEDDVNEGLKWRVWFGGDVQGLDSILPDIVCLHSLKSQEAIDCSTKVIKDIQSTNFDDAKALVKKGLAKCEDFWLMAGYAGWGPGQLAGEIDRKSWYMCATSSDTLLKELARQSQVVDPSHAGIETWETLMKMIGRQEVASKLSGNFDDLMLKEWSQASLVKDDDGKVGLARNPIGGAAIPSEVDSLMEDLQMSQRVQAGTLLRASSAERSPFLLTKQELHKGLLLILNDDDTKATVGCMIHLVASKSVEVRRKDRSKADVNIRYGGEFGIKGQNPLLWIHCSKKLRDAGIGTPLGSSAFSTVTQDDAELAISSDIASPDDFIVTSGVSIFPKIGRETLAREVKRGIFEIVDRARQEEAFKTLQTQAKLSPFTLDESIRKARKAWELCGNAEEPAGKEGPASETPGFDETDDRMVFNTDTPVSELAEDASRKWVATFLLGMPTI